MAIAFGNELNSSIDHDEVLDPRRRTEGRWFLEVRRSAARVKKSSAAEREHVTHRVLENMV
jgi:hypothetical protein